MRKILFICFIIISSCSKQNGEKDFEYILGKENIQTIDFIIELFENDLLKSKYPKLRVTESYRQFLIDYSENDLDGLKKLDEILNIYEESELKSAMYFHPDSAWILPNSTYDKIEEDSIVFLNVNRPYIKVKIRNQLFDSTDYSEFDYKYPEFDYERIYTLIDSTMNRDSLINIVLNLKIKKHQGRYFQGIQSMRYLGGFFELFADYKATSNDKKKFCDLVLNSADLNNMTIRKIIVLECLF